MNITSEREGDGREGDRQRQHQQVERRHSHEVAESIAADENPCIYGSQFYCGGASSSAVSGRFKGEELRNCVSVKRTIAW